MNSTLVSKRPHLLYVIVNLNFKHKTKNYDLLLFPHCTYNNNYK